MAAPERTGGGWSVTLRASRGAMLSDLPPIAQRHGRNLIHLGLKTVRRGGEEVHGEQSEEQLQQGAEGGRFEQRLLLRGSERHGLGHQADDLARWHRLQIAEITRSLFLPDLDEGGFDSLQVPALEIL